MKLILPLPPSVNVRKTLIKRLGRLIDSTIYRKYMKYAREEVFVQAKQQNWDMLNPTYENQLTVYITVYLPDKRRDATNCLKPLLDVLTQIIYLDDRWILPQFNTIIIDKNRPRIEVII